MSAPLGAFEADYKLRDKDCPQFRTHLKHIRDYFGAWSAIELSPEAVDKYIVEQQGSGSATATVTRSTQRLAGELEAFLEKGFFAQDLPEFAPEGEMASKSHSEAV